MDVLVAVLSGGGLQTGHGAQCANFDCRIQIYFMSVYIIRPNSTSQLLLKLHSRKSQGGTNVVYLLLLLSCLRHR